MSIPSNGLTSSGQGIASIPWSPSATRSQVSRKPFIILRQFGGDRPGQGSRTNSPLAPVAIRFDRVFGGSPLYASRSPKGNLNYKSPPDLASGTQRPPPLWGTKSPPSSPPPVLFSGRLQSGKNALPNPSRVPPLDGIDLRAVEDHGEVQVVPSRQAGLPGPSQ